MQPQQPNMYPGMMPGMAMPGQVPQQPQMGTPVQQGAPTLGAPQQLPGQVLFVGAGNGSIVGITPAGQIFKRDGVGAWQQLPGQGSRVDIADDGTLVMIGQNPPSAMTFVNGQWVNKPVAMLKEISVGSAAHIWGITNANALVECQAAMGGLMVPHTVPFVPKDVSVGVDGTVYALASASDAVYRLDRSMNTWVQLPGQLSRIAVHSANEVVGVNAQGQVFTLNPPSQWNHVATITNPIKDVSYGADGIYVVGTDQSIKHLPKAIVVAPGAVAAAAGQAVGQMLGGVMGAMGAMMGGMGNPQMMQANQMAAQQQQQQQQAAAMAAQQQQAAAMAAQQQQAAAMAAQQQQQQQQQQQAAALAAQQQQQQMMMGGMMPGGMMPGMGMQMGGMPGGAGVSVTMGGGPMGGGPMGFNMGSSPVGGATVTVTSSVGGGSGSACPKCMHNGQPQGGMGAFHPVPSGDIHYKCACPLCNGTKRSTHQNRCPVCNGGGGIDAFGKGCESAPRDTCYKSACKACDGKGYTYTARRTCTQCSGKGGFDTFNKPCREGEVCYKSSCGGCGGKGAI
eukprot:TRINITY_DN2181_c0_g1_i3.p1 TRINITY_DN2181_c0_g1~~TRINITY_DN2181_c0_g1_i3.p1  ORF type:complete len:564 (+),score=175.58 TRINITY_DN2181_c0_g1_i3:60-1751(+)